MTAVIWGAFAAGALILLWIGVWTFRRHRLFRSTGNEKLLTEYENAKDRPWIDGSGGISGGPGF